MPSSPSPAVARLRAFLEQLDVPSSTLKRDPQGRTWLPRELHAVLQSDAECRAELRRFVDRELELFDSVRQRNDAGFAKDVLHATHRVEIAGAGLDPRIRSWILGLFYALATVAGYIALAPLLGFTALPGLMGFSARPATSVGEHSSVLAQAKAAIGLGGEFGTSSWGLLTIGAAVALAVAMAFVPCRRPSRGA